ncbi:ABC transporter ATP-binding protein [Anaerocolumna xylanovorans]|uniref:ATP-binding cassette, subfamily B n=1 Tax=Anaerocolumna xylanovorans DSM 12503 TaxID=1121345 RepID=A0A1M7Y0J0_9FIRM|nr:ABC transporter ATP-binding protein [Anaerocolumna xylanovorans]SHO44870.1 ATP-binding cassette, subfamily B [Anaerocolumna xylanovorans DSM 12503]
MGSGVKNKHSHHKTGFRLMKLLHQTDPDIIPLSMLLSLLQTAIPYSGFFLFAWIIDCLTQSKYKEALHTAILLIGINLLLGLLADLLSQTLDYKGKASAVSIRYLIREKALALDLETMENAGVQEKINTTEFAMKLYGGIEQVMKCYQNIFTALLSVILSIAMIFILCFRKPESRGLLGAAVSPGMSVLFFAGALGVVILWQRGISKGLAKKQEANRNSHVKAEHQLGYMLSQVFMDYTKGKVIRISDMKGMIMKRYGVWRKITRKVYEEMVTMYKKSDTLSNCASGIFTAFSYLLVFLKVLTGAVSIGSFAKYVGAMTQFNTALSDIAGNNQDIEEICGYMSSFLEFLELENKRETGSIPIEKRLDNVYEIEFRGVSFAYPGSREKILNNISCKIRLKDKMALVGENGAGKSTFIKLLCRLYDPTEGYITLNGVDIRKYDYREYLSLFGIVFQDFKLFAFPIGDNIAASKEWDEEKLFKCLKQAGMKEWVQKKKAGLNTNLYTIQNGGEDISGGEAQKLALARALYKDAPFVILDEPTAALDPLSEYEIYTRFDELVQDKTSIYISHRMSSCRFCDDIMVLRKGEIAERGSHDKLLKQDGIYTNLWKAQAKYYA